MKRIHIGKLCAALLLPLIVGTVSASLSAAGMAAYGTMSKPPFSPPAWVFPVAWTILYLMMGLASYLILVTETGKRVRMTALTLYGIQLAMNFMWSILFFSWDMYLLAFLWLIVMWGLVLLCAIGFFRINRTAGYLLIPYVLWLTFAAYLNLGAWILSA